MKPVGNDFQNIERGEKRFKDLAFDPFAGLGEKDLATLRLNIQKRHIIGHNLGVVDSKFAEHAEEARLGETVHLVGDDIRRFGTHHTGDQRLYEKIASWIVQGTCINCLSALESDMRGRSFSERSGAAL